MSTKDPDVPYIVFSYRKEDDKVFFYFWTGEKLTGDLSQAKIHPTYADCYYSIWKGPLMDRTQKVWDLGFHRISYYPLKAAERDIKPEERGKHELVI